MRHKSTILMILSVLIAAGVAWRLSDRPTSDQLAERSRRLFPRLKTENVTAVTINAGTEEIGLRRNEQNGKHWVIKRPISIRADQERVESLLAKVAQATRQSRPIEMGEASSEKLAEYGLAPPHPAITLHTPQAHHTIQLGSETGLGNLVYATASSGNRIITVSRNLADALDLTLNDLRSKQLIPDVRLDQIQTVTIGRPASTPDIVVERSEGRWQITEPVPDLADEKRLRNLLKIMVNREIEPGDFVDDSRREEILRALNRSDTTVCLATENKKVAVSLAKTEGSGRTEYWAGSESGTTVASIPGETYEAISAPSTRGPDSLRQRSLLNFRTERVGEIMIERANSRLILRRKRGTWRFADTGDPADAKTVNSILQGMRAARVEAVTATTALPAGGKTCRVEIRDEAGRIVGVLQIGRIDAEADRAHVQRFDYPVVLAISKAPWVSDIQASRRALLDRKMLDEPPERAVKIIIKNRGQRFACRRNSPKAEWELTHPVRGKADEEMIDKILRGLNPLRARGRAANKMAEPRAYGLDSPSVHLTVTYRTANDDPKSPNQNAGDPATVERSVTVGSPKPGLPSGWHAVIGKPEPGKPVYILEPRVVTLWRAHPGSKRIAAAGELRRMSFRSGDTTHSFVRLGKTDDWQRPDGEPLGNDLQQVV